MIRGVLDVALPKVSTDNQLIQMMHEVETEIEERFLRALKQNKRITYSSIYRGIREIVCVGGK